MGHERLPRLPRSEKWRKIVSEIALTATNECTAEQVTRNTALAVDSRLRRLHLDPSLQDAFSFLVAVTVAARSDSPLNALHNFGVDVVGGSATPLALVRSLTTFMRKEGSSLEYLELARGAVAKALAEFYHQEVRQSQLFGKDADAFTVWRKASGAGGFCTLARQFFSALTTEYFKYFLDREASAVLPSVEAREDFQANVAAHIDRIARHNFETSKIAQSFAAGWYAKNAKKTMPSRRQVTRFLSVALNKIRDSLKAGDE